MRFTWVPGFLWDLLFMSPGEEELAARGGVQVLFVLTGFYCVSLCSTCMYFPMIHLILIIYLPNHVDA